MNQAIRKLSTDELGRSDIREFKQQEKLPVVLLLDNVRSALNVGSLFRTADAFALESLALCGISASPPNREINKTALGSTESVAWQYFESTQEAVRHFRERGYHIYAIEQAEPKVSLEAFAPLFDGERYVLILGNEVDGVSDDILPLCDGCIEIPQFGTKHSLNVAVAGGIAVWQMTVKYLTQMQKC